MYVFDVVCMSDEIEDIRRRVELFTYNSFEDFKMDHVVGDPQVFVALARRLKGACFPGRISWRIVDLRSALC